MHKQLSKVNHEKNVRTRLRTCAQNPTEKFNNCLRVAVSLLAANFDHFCTSKIPGAAKFRREFLKIDFGWEMACATTWELEREEKITLGKYFPKDGITPARVIVYRGPVEWRTSSIEQRVQLIHKIITPIVYDALKVPEKYQVPEKYRILNDS